VKRRASHRPERVGEVIRQAVGAFLASEVRDPRIGFVTVTSVTVSPDLSTQVWVSVMAATMSASARSRGCQRRRVPAMQLSRQLATRVTPELTFALDRGLQHAQHIDRMLRDLKGEGGGAPEGEG
jgi:ribosome-binding factor A